jgi:hypothetical protein
MRYPGKVALILLLFCIGHCPAQDLTVNILDQQTLKPVVNAVERLHYGCDHSMHPIELKQKTNAAGTTTFHSVSLQPLEFCVFPDLDTYASQELPYVFMTPTDAAHQHKSLNKVFTTLPAEVSFHVRRRSFFERLRHLSAYD